MIRTFSVRHGHSFWGAQRECGELMLPPREYCPRCMGTWIEIVDVKPDDDDPEHFVYAYKACDCLPRKYDDDLMVKGIFLAMLGTFQKDT